VAGVNVNAQKIIGLALGLTVLAIVLPGFTPRPCTAIGGVVGAVPMSTCDMNLGR